MKVKNLITVIGSTGLAVALLSGCGSQAYRETAFPESQAVLAPAPTPTYTVTPSPSPTPTATGLPNYTSTFEVVGHIAGQEGASATISGINTDNILLVRVTSGPSGGIGGGASNNFPTDYGCVSYRITVLGQSVQTSQLSVPGIASSTCPGAPTSQTLNLSNRLTVGHGAVDIKVDNVMTDARFWVCMKNAGYYTWNPYYGYPSICQSYYPTTLNYDARMNGFTGAYIATGSLEIAVNGTVGF